MMLHPDALEPNREVQLPQNPSKSLCFTYDYLSRFCVHVEVIMPHIWCFGYWTATAQPVHVESVLLSTLLTPKS